MLLLVLGCMDYTVNPDTPDATEPDPEMPATLSPRIQADPGLLDFGSVSTGTLQNGVVTLSNIGDETLWLSDLRLEGDDVFDLAGFHSDTLEPGESGDVVLTYAPNERALSGTSLFVESDDPETPVLEVPLLGTGIAPELWVDPLSHDFGELGLGSLITQDIQIVNLGDADLVFEDVVYEASSSELSADLSQLPTSLAPAEAVRVTVEYSPTDAQPDEGALILTTNDPETPMVSATQTGIGAGCSTGTDGAPECTYTLYNSEDRSSGMCVDDIVHVYLDSDLIFESPDDKAGCESPVTFTASPGQLLTFEGYDYWGNCRGIEEIWLHNEELDVMTKLSSGRLDGCNGYASGMTMFFWAREAIPAI